MFCISEKKINIVLGKSRLVSIYGNLLGVGNIFFLQFTLGPLKSGKIDIQCEPDS